LEDLEKACGNEDPEMLTFNIVDNTLELKMKMFINKRVKYASVCLEKSDLTDDE
jgi:hypothetical protein